MFTGFDQRESRGWHAFAQSVVDRTRELVAITPLAMDAQRDGTNRFTYSRFLVPWLCGFEGRALFMDGADMVLMAGLEELWNMHEGWFPVKVVKHSYATKHVRKYVGTEMEAENRDYPRKNWSSVILWDCGHYMNRCLTPEYVAAKDGAFLHGLQWVPDERIGELPVEWNWLVDEYGRNTAAKLLHWTAGIPGIDAYRRAPQAQAWHYHAARALEVPAAQRIAEVESER